MASFHKMFLSGFRNAPRAGSGSSEIKYVVKEGEMLPDVYKQCDYVRITFEISSESLEMRVKCFPRNYSI